MAGVPDDTWVDEVTMLLLEEFDGRAKFRKLRNRMYQTKLTKNYKTNEVLEKLRSIKNFLVFDTNTGVKYVSVYWDDVNICCKSRRRTICAKENCLEYHLCKFFISSSCAFGSQCRYGHDLTNKANKRVSDRLGLSSFSAEEIRTIIFRSHPVVCVKYNTGGCDDDDCPDLHVCYHFILKQCRFGGNCKFGHTLRSGHNRWVLDTFDLSFLTEEELRKRILVKRLLASSDESCVQQVRYGVRTERKKTHRRATDSQKQSDDNIQDFSNSDSLQDADPSNFEYICEVYTWMGDCPRAWNCPRYHNPDRLPYLWLFQLDGRWHRVTDSVRIEKSFCDRKDVEDEENPYCFCAMTDVFEIKGKDQSVKLRRLSTPSYVEASPGTPLHLYTQWVWYWEQYKDVYQPYYPESLQYTLEEKYLTGQHKYYLQSEEHHRMVDTRSSSMIQTNLDTQRCRKILRRPVFIKTKKSKLPTMVSLLLHNVPKSTHQMPKHWTAVDRFQNFEWIELDSADQNYATVERKFFFTMDINQHKIVRMFRVQNPALWTNYYRARRAMTPKGQAPNDVEEWLFHGTPTLQAVRGICAESFDCRRSGEHVGALYGKGAYFSTMASYSHKYTRAHTPVTGDPLRFMFLAKVLVGQYTLGHPSYTNPPNRDGLKSYDSCVDDESNPIIFVIFALAQSYPEYLIQYTDVLNSRQRSRPATPVSPSGRVRRRSSPHPCLLFRNSLGTSSAVTHQSPNML